MSFSSKQNDEKLPRVGKTETPVENMPTGEGEMQRSDQGRFTIPGRCNALRAGTVTGDLLFLPSSTAGSTAGRGEISAHVRQ